MKPILLFFLVSFSLPVWGSKTYTIDRMILTTSGMTTAPQHSMVIDASGNKYVSSLFKHTITFGNDVLAASPNSNSILSSWGIYAAKFAADDSYAGSTVLAYGDSIWTSAMKWVGQHLFVAVAYNHILNIGTDTLLSKGKGDVALLKFNASLQLVDKRNIGGESDERFAFNGLDCYNGQLYLALNVNRLDTGAAFNPYSLVLGPDTLHFDYDTMHSKGDYVLSRLDTMLQPLYSRSMGGQNYNACLGIRVGPQGVFILGSTQAWTGNEVGGMLFNYSPCCGTRYFMAKLDHQFAGKWVRKIEHSGWGSLFLRKMALAGDRIVFSGNTTQGSGCQVDQVQVLMDYAPPIGNGQFTFCAAYDTAGAYKWAITNEDYFDYFYSTQQQQLYFAKTVSQNEVMGGDTLFPCSGFDLAIGTIHSTSAQRKQVLNLCSNGTDQLLTFAEDANHKLYALGITNAGMVELADTLLYPNQGIGNLFYLSLDSVDVFPLPVSNLQAETTLRLYPNPATDEVVIERPPDPGPWTIVMTDAMGHTILTQTGHEGSSDRVSISHLPSGIVFVQVHTPKQILVQKLFIQ